MSPTSRRPLAFLAALLVAVALTMGLVVAGNVVTKPLGTAGGFAVGAFAIAARHDLAADTGLPERWLAALGLLVAVAVPLLLIVA